MAYLPACNKAVDDALQRNEFARFLSNPSLLLHELGVDVSWNIL